MSKIHFLTSAAIAAMAIQLVVTGPADNGSPLGQLHPTPVPYVNDVDLQAFQQSAYSAAIAPVADVTGSIKNASDPNSKPKSARPAKRKVAPVVAVPDTVAPLRAQAPVRTGGTLNQRGWSAVQPAASDDAAFRAVVAANEMIVAAYKQRYEDEKRKNDDLQSRDHLIGVMLSLMTILAMFSTSLAAWLTYLMHRKANAQKVAASADKGE
jgi:hypothetical protein